MILSRLLATLALVVAGLAIPVPAAADAPPARTPSPETLRSACTAFGGTYREVRSAYACEVSDGTILCTERCVYQTRERLTQPPLLEPCEWARGSFLNVRDLFSCRLDEGDFSVDCPGWLGPLTVCDLVFVQPSEQPMTD